MIIYEINLNEIKCFIIKHRINLFNYFWRPKNNIFNNIINISILFIFLMICVVFLKELYNSSCINLNLRVLIDSLSSFFKSLIKINTCDFFASVECQPNGQPFPWDLSDNPKQDVPSFNSMPNLNNEGSTKVDPRYFKKPTNQDDLKEEDQETIRVLVAWFFVVGLCVLFSSLRK